LYAVRQELGIKNDALLRALDAAVAGPVDKLYQELAKASGLPGPRANVPLANAFADECVRRGRAVDQLLTKMSELHPDHATGGSPFEFVVMCGVLGLGARGAADQKVRARALTLLHASADDLRFRVRDAVVISLERLGAVMGDALVEEVAGWMDGFFHAANVLTALSHPMWLDVTHDADAIVARLHEAAELVLNAPRSSMRYPGYKALLDALRAAPGPLSSRHGVRVLDEVHRWTTLGNVDLREAATAAVKNTKTESRFGDAVAKIRESRDANIPAPRDGKKVEFRPTRRRGKKRG
jgi:hypothetical protein